MFLPKRRLVAAATPPALRSEPDARRLVSFESLDGDPLDCLLWTNEATGSFHFVPDSFRLTVDVANWLAMNGPFDGVELQSPSTWVTNRPTWRSCSPTTQLLDWIVTPDEFPAEFAARVMLSALTGPSVQSTVERSLTVEIHGVSQFDPARHALREVNNVSGWGVVEPDREIFDRTYHIALFPNAFFSGLYRSIVFLGGSIGGYGGGLCTGMARAALERSLAPDAGEPGLKEVVLWHGRQLTDRALLASAPWFLVPSPRRAFQAFRRDVIACGRTTRCFDIAVPKPWRADIVTALQREGHTVVPYAFRQIEPGRAEVSVYDPNEPQASIAGSTVMTFDLARDTYAYHGMAALDNRRITVITVDQEAYRRGRTAILAGLASWLLQFNRASITRWWPTRTIERVARTIANRA